MRTRPTADRVREALFSVLGDLHGAIVADLFAGSGALGLEAMSRGAERAVFVEAARAAARIIEANAAALGVADRVVVLVARVERSRDRLDQLGPFDLLLCDPPWPIAAEAADAVAALVADGGVLAPDGTVVLGHRASEPVVPNASVLRLDERRTWGDSGMSLFRRTTASD